MYDIFVDRVILFHCKYYIKQKSLYLRTGSFFENGGEGGIDSARWASPCGQSAREARRLSPWLRQWSNPGRGFSSLPERRDIKQKSPYLRTGSFFEYGGEGGIRTLDTLPYTHFPGVLLQPLGHLTILSCCSPWVGNGALL